MIPGVSPLHRISLRSLVAVAVITLVSIGLTACTRFRRDDVPPDTVADQLVARLKQTNIDLQRFKCLGKMALSSPEQPSRSFRAALAGQLGDRLRIDMFAPFGGAAGTLASDGHNLFLVMHPSREYYKKRFGRGSLRRLVQIDITVGDLLELMVGRIPIVDDDHSARLLPAGAGLRDRLEIVDRSGRVRQRITLDESMHPCRSEWFDRHRRTTHNLRLDGWQIIDGFRLPQRIELIGPDGARVAVSLERYEANAELDARMFMPENPWS